ncbi:MAG: Smr/MutS family protein [Acidobacteriota bacterium]
MSNDPRRRRSNKRAPFPAPSDEESRQFLEAMERLGAVPDKDHGAGSPTSTTTGTRRRKQAAATARVDAEIDLHGFGVREALDELDRRLPAARVQGARRVRVITGRGLRSDEGQAVVRGAVLGWLKTDGRRFVASVEPDAASRGGAFLVRLR